MKLALYQRDDCHLCDAALDVLAQAGAPDFESVWIDGDAADGFILGFPVIAEGLDDFVRYVVPILEERGVYSRTLAGNTLRDHLGLPFRESQYGREAAGSQATEARA